MKKMILTAAVIAAAAMTVSCNKDTENTGLSVDAEAINYPLSGGTYDINLTSGKPWKALYCAEWLTVTPESAQATRPSPWAQTFGPMRRTGKHVWPVSTSPTMPTPYLSSSVSQMTTIPQFLGRVSSPAILIIYISANFRYLECLVKEAPM